MRPPETPGLVVTDMVEGALTGVIRAMYVVGENPLLSEPDLHHARKALEQLESAANFLTNSACDPSSKIPEYK